MDFIALLTEFCVMSVVFVMHLGKRGKKKGYVLGDTTIAPKEEEKEGGESEEEAADELVVVEDISPNPFTSFLT